jgi:hypothetical protein
MPTIASGPKRTDTGPQLPYSMENIRNITPNKINGLLFWLDASDPASITLSNDGTVNRVISWRDKSANALNLNIGSPYASVSNFPFQSTIQGSPYNTIYFSTGMTAIRTSGSIVNGVRSFFFLSPQLQRVPGTNAGDMDAAFIFGSDGSFNWHGGNSPFFLHPGFPSVDLRNSIGNLRAFNKTSNTLLSQSNTLVNITPYSNANTSILMWSTAILPTATTAFNGIGFDRNYLTTVTTKNRGFPGHIGEIVMFNRNLSTQEEGQMVSYLTQKWFLQCNVPGEAAYNQSVFNLAATPRFFTPYTQFNTRIGFRFLTYTLPISNVQFWFDAMDTSVFTDINNRSPPTPNNPIGLNVWRNKGTFGTIGQFTTGIKPEFNIFETNRYPQVNTRGGSFSGFFSTPAPYPNPLYAYPNGKNMTCFIVFTVYSGGGAIFTLHSNFGFDAALTGQYFGVIANTTQFGYSSGLTPMFAATITTNRTYVGTIIINCNTTSTGGALPSNGLINLNGAYATNSSNIGRSNYNIVQMGLFGYVNSGITQRGQGINEVVCCYRAVTTQERVAMENQLLAKWGIARNQPVAYLGTDVPVTSGLTMWYDAYLPAFVMTNASNHVTSWLDRSGNGFHMSNAGLNPVVYTTLTGQTASLPALQFTFSNATSNFSALQNFNISNFVTSTITTIATGFFTQNPVSGLASRILSLGSTINAFEQIHNSVLINQIYNQCNLSGNYTQNNFQIRTFLANAGVTSNGLVGPSNMIYYINGSNPSSCNFTYQGMLTFLNARIGASLFNINDLQNGAVRTGQGFFTELLVWNRCLTIAELNSVHSYLFNKWTIVSNAPVASVPVTSGLNLWLDAYDPAQVVRDSGGNVWLWRDKSGCNFHFSNNGSFGAEVLRPTYSTTAVGGLPGLLFSTDGVNLRTSLSCLNISYPITPNLSIFIVFQQRSLTLSGRRLIAFTLLNDPISTDYGYTNGFSVTQSGTTNIAVQRSNVIPTAEGGATTGPNLTSVIFNRSNTTIPDISVSNIGVGINGVIRVNSSNGSLQANFNFNQAWLGTRNNAGDSTSYYDGYLSEIILYNRTVSFIERQQIESYLLNKWNI